MIRSEERRFNRLMLAGLIVGFALLIAAFALVVQGLRNTGATAQLIEHTYEVKDMLSELTIALERSEAARRGYLIEASDYRRNTYQRWIVQVVPNFERLERLVRDNSEQGKRIEALRPLIDAELEALSRSMSLALSGQREEARQDFIRHSTLENLQAIREGALEIAAAEDQLLAERRARSERQLDLLRWLLIGAGVMLASVTGFTFWLVRRFTSDLLASRARLHVLNTDLEGAVAERTEDLQRANDEIQRFAYIVSHDLRSPLVNVMGFTAEMERADKVMKQFVDKVAAESPDRVPDEVRYAAHEDLPEAIGFIRSSTQKMDRLINAILALSRQGKRVLTPELLPMGKVIAEIAASLEMLAAERNARFMFDETLPDIFHDRLAIEQIFTNLMENATKYLRPEEPGVVMVRGRLNGSRAIFEVEDNGRGIAPEDRERVFDLFRRAGPQDQAGEGIGLANVRALAYRLGGTVKLTSELGVGSTFIVDLPREFS